jgi:hypothetical protein
VRRLPCIAAVLLLLAGAGSAIAQKAPDPADLLFDTPQWRTATAGSEIVYRYRRASPLEDVFGSSMDDRIRLDLEAGASDTSRTVRVQMFSEGRRKPAGPFEDVEGNPVIVLFLEHHLANLAHVLKANPRYLKNAIRAGLREKAVMTPATATIRDEPVPVMRIETRPFLEDPNKDRMRGLESLTYTFTISDQVPGTILSIEARATAADGAELLRESVTYDETVH